MQEIDEPLNRYADIIQIYKNGKNAKVKAKWNLDEIFVEDFITPSGNDWNFDQHKKIDTMPNLADFKKTVSDYLSWEVSQILKKDSPSRSRISLKIEKLEREFKASGGEFREFRLDEIFELKSSKKIFHAQNLKIYDEIIAGSYPYVVRSTIDNGIRGYVIEDEQYLNEGNTLSFAQDTFSVFYQKLPYFTGNKVKILKSKFDDFNSKIALYIVANFNKVLREFTWGIGSNVDSISRIKILLPTIGGKISFAFMQSFVEELEAYLAVTGLKDYKLTQSQSEALAKFDEIYKRGGVESLKFSEFSIGDLFDIYPTKNYGYTNSDLFSTIGETPVIVNSSQNNGIGGYVDLKPTENGNIITFSDTTTSDSIFYQPKDFVGYSHVQGMHPYNDLWQKYSLIYFVVNFRKITNGLFNYGNKFNRKIVKDMQIKLPINENGELNFDFMQNFIKAVEKLVIKDVVLWADSKIATTKFIITKNKTNHC